MAKKRDALSPRASGALEHYDPQVGVKQIITAETMEKYYRRAKDTTGLCDAVELKMSEQRKFVLWWDEQEKHHWTRLASQTDNARSLPDFGLDRDTVHRWRTRLSTPRDYAVALEAAQARCVRVCEASKGATEQRGASFTGEFEWYTPQEYIEAARDVLGAIDLDPASTALAQTWIRATQYYDIETDGLAHEWPGRVWLNPPYRQPDIAEFVEKLCTEVEAGRTTAAMLLTNNSTDTAWFHRAAGCCRAICFTRGRIAFINVAGEPVAAPTQGQAFFYFFAGRSEVYDGGLNVSHFAARFSEVGFTVVPR